MKIYPYKYCIFLALLFLLAACRKNELSLDQAPEFPWQTIEEFEMAIVTPYAKAFYGGWPGAFYMDDVVFFEGMTDLIYMIPNTSENYPQVEVYYRSTITRTNRTEESFKASYACVNAANSALDFINNRDRYRDAKGNHIFDLLSSTELIELDRQMGELYFMRAFSYYYNTMRHCMPAGTAAFSNNKVLPWRKEWTFNADELRYPEYASGKKIYDSIIIPDLLKAIELLPLHYSSSNHPSYKWGRANRYAAVSILVRVYFQYGAENALYYQKALDLLGANGPLGSIETWPYTMNEDPIAAFNRSVLKNADEVIWDAIYCSENLRAKPYDATLFTWNKHSAFDSDQLPYASDSSIAAINKSNRCTWHVYSMSKAISHYIGWMDTAMINDSSSGYYADILPTTQASFDKRYQQLYVLTTPAKETDNPFDKSFKDTRFTWVKRPNIWSHKYFRGADGERSNVPVIRIPELYLTKAILEYILTADDKGASEINTIGHARYNVGGFTDFTSGTITESEIEKEWIRELSFEGGHRLRYLFAMKKNIPAGDRGQLGVIPYPYHSLMNSDGGIWLIPLAETDFRN